MPSLQLHPLLTLLLPFFLKAVSTGGPCTESRHAESEILVLLGGLMNNFIPKDRG